MTDALVWFRRDLRLEDHAALAEATARHGRVHGVFVLDPGILQRLPPAASRRVSFLLGCLASLDSSLRELGGGLLLERGPPVEVLPALARRLGVATVYANRDYEPAAQRRDHAVGAALTAAGIGWRTWQDQVVFEPDAVLTQTGKPFAVFTPYLNAWRKKLTPDALKPHKVLLGKWAAAPDLTLPTLSDLGLSPATPATGVEPGTAGARKRLSDFLRRIDDYQERRDYPALKGPSYLSPHLRFGTISIRTLMRAAQARDSAGARTWLTELVWREFYFMILAQHPHVANSAYRPQYDALEWDEAPTKLAAWQAGCTGYPIVDAAMRQLNTSGYMHNRLRMIVASFLTKDLHLDWRAGEQYFAAQLLDHDLAANNGGWQWAASTGCDAQPYFRIFNPVSQSERFDAGGKFIRRYVPELASLPNKFVHAPWTLPASEQRRLGCVIGRDYPPPVVDHARERRVALDRYARVATVRA